MKFVTVTIIGWILFLILAIINAGIRNTVYKPVVGDLAAHQISTIIFMIIIMVFTYILLRFSQINLNDSEAFLMGIIWFFLTIVFEFVAGHYMFGNSWEKLIADYNILKGRVWSLVLLTTLIAPYITNKFL